MTVLDPSDPEVSPPSEVWVLHLIRCSGLIKHDGCLVWYCFYHLQSIAQLYCIVFHLMWKWSCFNSITPLLLKVIISLSEQWSSVPARLWWILSQLLMFRLVSFYILVVPLTPTGSVDTTDNQQVCFLSFYWSIYNTISSFFKLYCDFSSLKNAVKLHFTYLHQPSVISGFKTPRQ